MDGWLRRLLLGLLVLGAYLSIKGYESRDGDQAYRLPILLHQQDARLFAHDPFVRSFDAFNPHRGYLAILDVTSRVVGLSTALFLWFSLTLLLTASAFARLARAVWPELSERAAVISVVMVFLLKAGNIGTNHLFEATLLDRLFALSIGWHALADFVVASNRLNWRAPLLIGIAAIIHPSIGLQLGCLLACASVLRNRFGCDTTAPRGGDATAALLTIIALVPGLGLAFAQSADLFEGLSTSDFRTLSLYVQGPQHMVPHLWRTTQVLAWFGLIGLGIAALVGNHTPPGRRLGLMLGTVLAGLGLAWVAIEPFQSLRVAVFQPFRMATVARGLALVALSGPVLALWDRATWTGRVRAGMLIGGLLGDNAMLAVTVLEAVLRAIDRIAPRYERVALVAGLALGLSYLARHDTQSGHHPILAAIGLALAVSALARARGGWQWHRPRIMRLALAAWALPALALIVPGGIGAECPLAKALARHCRFGEVPIDAVERLALWSRENTPADARFIGPPGPKTFRLWSRRAVAFNRAASPYHAEGLGDWAQRFQAHVGFRGTTAEFAQAYLENRQRLERGYESLTDHQLEELAHSQGARYALCRERDGTTLRALRVEGGYVLYEIGNRSRVAVRSVR